MAVPVGLAETNTFVAVLAQKRFTEAAKQQLGLSPPRVSEMVRALEKGLGGATCRAHHALGCRDRGRPASLGTTSPSACRLSGYVRIRC